MKIIYYSNLVPLELREEIKSKTGSYPSQAAQKFHSLLSEGLKNFTSLQNISSLPISGDVSQEIECKNFQNHDFFFTGFNKKGLIRQIFNVWYSFILTFKLYRKNNINYAVFDYLNQSVTIGGYIACMILKVKKIVIVTDLPQYQHINKNKGLINNLVIKFLLKFLNSFDGYILLTKQMNEVVNKNLKPNIIMEGLVDANYEVGVTHEREKIILYAGGLYEKYGVKKLINAFLALELNDFQLHLYGWGDLEQYIKSCEVKHNNIKFFGVVPNSEIVKLLPECTLLVNPRPSSLELSKFSFPSKILEYMLSATPVVTTRLPGIPEDYSNHLYFFDDESEIGIKNTLNNLMSLSSEELFQKGQLASKFVMNEKSNKIQAQKIVNFLYSNPTLNKKSY